ncbi:protein HESO1-like isoform X1 [Apium graveolens]|uniref:protein HESO1-like isoform X1 n=1 Tax=Apium graveolens TaxID=4045 RepID=UPI003D7935AA
MSFYGLVEHTLRDILLLINPTRDDWGIRFHIIEDIRAAVQTVESLRGATVEPFGSFVSNLFTRWGDLDISIEILTNSYISNTAKKQKQNLLRDVLKALRSKGTWRKLKYIGNARVPILKLEHNLQNISCDISINNLNGQMKSKLLFWINDIDGRFRDMVLLVKEWAKAHDINDSKSGSLNSYSLSLLIIFHFQTCVPAILPPLKDIYPGNLSDDLKDCMNCSWLHLNRRYILCTHGLRTVAEKHVEEICAANINKFRLDKSRQINESSLSTLLISFFAKFSDINTRASIQGISPYSGQWEDIGSNMTWLPRTYALYVEDPFEQPVNTARSVIDKHLIRIADAFRTTYFKLTSHNHNRSTLLAALIKRDRLSYETRSATARNSNNPGNYQPQIDRALSSPLQAHHSRSTVVNLNPNMHRPVPSNQNTVVNLNRNMHRPVPSNQNTVVNLNPNIYRPVPSNQNTVVNLNPNMHRPVQSNQNTAADIRPHHVNFNRAVQANYNRIQQTWRSKPNS